MDGAFFLAVAGKTYLPQRAQRTQRKKIKRLKTVSRKDAKTQRNNGIKYWIPAFAGMTINETDARDFEALHF